MSSALERTTDERINWRSSIPFILFHFSPLLVFFTGVSLRSLALCVGMYVVRMWFITAGYHRYFAHRSYRTSRFFQFVLAFGGSAAVQKGVLWWAAHHRGHHRYTDTDRDLHTPLKGIWQSHVGWILCDRYSETDLDSIEDFARFPELRFINRHDWIAPWTFAIFAYLVDGWRGVVVGFLTSTVLLWHATFSVNSLAHLIGRRRYATADTSRNSVFVALITGGEGWHNNHHHYPPSARQGFFWWEFDPTYYVLRALALLGIVRDLRQPSAAAKAGPRVRQGALDVGLLRSHVLKATAVATRSRSRAPESADGLDDLETALAGSIATAKAVARGSRRRMATNQG